MQEYSPSRSIDTEGTHSAQVTVETAVFRQELRGVEVNLAVLLVNLILNVGNELLPLLLVVLVPSGLPLLKQITIRSQADHLRFEKMLAGQLALNLITKTALSDTVR